jgi:hypothetical protein
MKEIAIVVASIVLIISGVGGCMGIQPVYHVWQQEQEGKAELSKAEYSRRVAIVEAEAKLQAAKSLAQADIVRAGGEAQANHIIGESLMGEKGQARLRYLWIDRFAENGKPSIVYVPTEANIPIMEAGRRP